MDLDGFSPIMVKFAESEVLEQFEDGERRRVLIDNGATTIEVRGQGASVSDFIDNARIGGFIGPPDSALPSPDVETAGVPAGSEGPASVVPELSVTFDIEPAGLGPGYREVLLRFDPEIYPGQCHVYRTNQRLRRPSLSLPVVGSVRATLYWRIPSPTGGAKLDWEDYDAAGRIDVASPQEGNFELHLVGQGVRKSSYGVLPRYWSRFR
jgi:hypothetical protein